jgi:predicted outer membrane repeat protein
LLTSILVSDVRILAQGCDSIVPAADTSALIAAVSAANGSQTDDTICLTTSTYTFASNQVLPVITGNTVINGDGALFNASSTPANSSYYYIIDSILGATLTLENLSITGRQVRAVGPLNMTGITLTGSQLDTSRTTFIDDSVIQNGKSYISRGHTTITNTDFIGNNGSKGAAIDNRGSSLAISDSRFIGNSGTTATSDGGAISTIGILSITDTLFENNSSGDSAAAIIAANDATITRSIFRGNSLIAPASHSVGTIAISSGKLTLTESCILDNRPAAKSVGYTSMNYGSTARNNWWGVETGPGTGTPLIPVDATNLDFAPHLIVPPDYCPVMQAVPDDQTLSTAVGAPLEIRLNTWGGRPPYTYDNVGTPAHGTLAGSIPNLTYTPDAGYEGADEFTFQTTDDDGTIIVARAVILIGDAKYPATIPVSSTAQEVPFVTNGNCTLGEAIQAASTNTAVDACPAGRVFGIDVIDLPTNTYTMTTSYFTFEFSATALPRVIGQVHLNGNGSIVTRGGVENMRFLYVDALGVLSIENTTFSGGRLDNISVTGRNYNGGAIYVDNGQLTVDEVIFSNNFARNGGAIATKDTFNLTARVRSSTFISNSMGASGGAIFGAAEIIHSLFENNFSLSASSGSGGALSGRMVIDNSTLRGNRAAVGGAAKLELTSTVTDSLFEDNSSNSQGGALHLSTTNLPLAVTTSVFRNNKTISTTSAAIHMLEPSHTNGFISVSESCFYGNTANMIWLPGGNQVEARNNWWGHSTGPVVLPAIRPGQTINSTSRYQPHKTTPPTGCEAYPPDPGSQTISALYLQPTAITLTAVNGVAPYTFAITQPPTKGTLSGTIPNLTYTTNIDVMGSDSFTFTATNNTGEVATGTVTINIVSDIAATDQMISVPHDAGTPITLGATGGIAPLGFTITTLPQHGTLSGTTPNLIYTPAFPYHGADSFTFTVTDQGNFTDTGTIAITVVNPLVAADQTIYTGFNEPKALTLTVTSPYLPLSYSNLTTPVHGTLTGTPPNLTYTPATGYTGADSFTFTVTDSAGFTDSAMVTLQTATQLIVKDVYSYTRPATPRYINLTPTGGRGPYTYDIPEPAHGRFMGTPPWVYYFPDDEFVGVSGTTYTVTDANGTSITAALKITTSPGLDAIDQTVYTPFETAIFMVMQGRGGYPPYTFAITTPPAHGTLIGLPPYTLYMPSAGYSGTDRVVFTVTDAEGFPAIGYIDITVGDALVLPDLSLEAIYETPLAVTLAPTGGTAPFIYELMTPPAHGTLTGSAPDIIYRPANGYSGTDSFVFRVTDRFGRADEGTISLAIPVPFTVAAGDTAGFIAAVIAANGTPQHDTILLTPGEYVFADEHSSFNALPPITNPLNIRGNLTTLRRTGAEFYRFIHIAHNITATLDGLTFIDGNSAMNGSGGAIYNDGILTVVNSVFLNNRAGLISSPYRYGGAIANSGTLYVTDSSFTGNAANYGVISSNANRTLEVVDSIFTDNPSSAIYFVGSGGLSGLPLNHIHGNCFVGNGAGVNNAASIATGDRNARISVTGNWWGAYDGPATSGNNRAPGGHGDKIFTDYDDEFLTAPRPGCGVLPPVAADESLIGVTGRERIIILDPAGGLPPYYYTIDAAPQHGTLSGTAPNFVYTSAVGYSGPDSLTYTVTNSIGGGSDTATISLAIRQPLTPGHAFTTERNVEIAIPVGSDDGQPPFTFTELVQPEHGYVGQTDKYFYYFPDLDYTGTDSFSYRITDGLGDSVIETVSIDVTPRAPATITVDTTAIEDSPFVVNGNCTIGEAFVASATNTPIDACAAGTSGVDIIDLPEGTFTRVTTASWMTLPGNAVVRGAGMGKTILTAAPTVINGILKATGGSPTIQELTIRGGYAGCCDQYDGGALKISTSNITVRLVHFDANRAWHQGGAIYSSSGSLYIVSSVFTTNDSTYGAGIRTISPTTATILHSAFEGNIAPGLFQAFYLAGPATLHLNCIQDGGSVNEKATDLRYNYGLGDEPSLTQRPPICDYIIDTPEPSLNISVAAGDTVGLIAAIEQVNAFGNGEVRVADGEYVLTDVYPAASPYGSIGLPPITGNVVIRSPNSAVIRREGATPFRFFTVDGGKLSLVRIRLINGLADTAAAIHVDGGGSLSMGRNRFENNTSLLGGAIIVVADGSISSNTDVYLGNTGGAHIGAGATGVMLYGCYLYNTGAGITNDAANPVFDGTGNWWDSVDGPSGAGSGHGDPVGTNVDFSGFKTTRPADCPTGRVHVFDQSAEMLAYDGSTPLTFIVTGGDGTYSIVTDMPAHGTLTGNGAARIYTPDAGFIGDDSFTVTATDGAGRTDSGTFTVTVRLAEIIVDSIVQEAPFLMNGNCTLGEAIHAANTDSPVDACQAGSGRDIIVLQQDAIYTLTAVADTTLNATGLPPITSDMNIDGNSSTIARDPSAPEFRLLAVELNGILRLDSVTLTGGRLMTSSGQHIGGGAIYVRGTLNTTNVTISGNYSTIGGGARLNGVSTIRDSLFTANTATQTGGGAYVCGSTLVTPANQFFDTDFIGNAAATGGGAVHYRCRPMTMTGGRITNNASPLKGSSIYAEPQSSPYTIALTGVIIEDNPGPQGSVYAIDGVRLSIGGSCILEEMPTVGIITTAGNYSYYDVAATNNWWGSSTGTRYGTAVSGKVTTTPHLTTPILDCGIRPTSAVDLTLYTAYDTAVPVVLASVDGMPPYAYEIKAMPMHGTLGGTAPELIYTPDLGYSGTDTFTYISTDTLGASDIATVSITVATDLSAEPTFFGTDYDTPVTIYISPVGGRTPYTLSLVSQPQYGTLVHDGTFIYTPSTSFTGTDIASIRITDANGDVYDAEFNIAVGGQVAAVDQQFVIEAGAALTFRLLATGGTPGSASMPTSTPFGPGYNDDYSFSTLSEPLHGTLYTTDGIHWTYIADAGFIGYENLTFTVTDMHGATDDGVITIEVSKGPNATPGETLAPTATLTPSNTLDPCTYFTPTSTHPPMIISPTHSGGGDQNRSCAATYTPTFTPTLTPTITPSQPITSTASSTPSFTPSLTATLTLTSTLHGSSQPTDIPSPTVTPTASSTPSFTPSLTATLTLTSTLHGSSQPPSRPNLLAPFPNIQLADSAPVFTWGESSASEAVHWYKLVVKNAMGETVYAAKVMPSLCVAGICSRQVRDQGIVLKNGAHTWFVQVKNAAGKAKSKVNTLVIEFPGATELISPLDGLITTERGPLFSWSQVSLAAQYRLQIRKNDKTVYSRWFSTTDTSCDGAVCTVDLAAFNVKLPRGKLQWRVDTRNKPLGPSVSKSEWRQLKIIRPSD